jgi:hypothetical protein
LEKGNESNLNKNKSVSTELTGTEGTEIKSFSSENSCAESRNINTKMLIMVTAPSVLTSSLVRASGELQHSFYPIKHHVSKAYGVMEALLHHS